MKKVVVLAAVVASLFAFTSCNKDVKECWEITITQKMDFMGEKETSTTTTYVYGTEDEADAMIKQLTGSSVSMPGANVSFDAKKKKADKAESDCFGVNIDM